MRTETQTIDATALAITVLDDYQWGQQKNARSHRKAGRVKSADHCDAEALALQTVIDDMERRRK